MSEEKVDLSKAVKGSKVYFRSGGHETIHRIDVSDSHGRDLKITFEGGFEPYCCYNNDGFYNRNLPHPFDIIRVEPPAFNWDDLRPGMAFEGSNGKIMIFTSWSWITQDDFVTLTKHSHGAFFQDRHSFWHSPKWCAYVHLKRSPKHDMEVKP